MKRALVTGCAGFIGSHLTDRLLGADWAVVGVDCFNDNYARRQKLANLEHARGFSGFTFIPLDLSRGDLGDVVAGCDIVFHLAAEPGVRPSWGQRFETYLRNNVHATQLVLDSLSGDDHCRLVYASSSSIYGDDQSFPTSEGATPHPISPYGVTKLAAEHLVDSYRAQFELDAVILRFFTVYGPRQRPDMAFHKFIRAALAGEELIVFGDGTQVRDFTFVADVVDALIAAATVESAPERAYNIGGGQAAVVKQALATIEELLERPLDVAYVERQAGDVRRTGADIALAQRDLGFRPDTALEVGLQAQVDWMRSAGIETGVSAG